MSLEFRVFAFGKNSNSLLTYPLSPKNMSDTLQSLLELLGREQASAALAHIDDNEHSYIKDLKINVSNALKFQHLTEKEIALLVLATAINSKSELLINTFKEKAINLGSTSQEIAEIYAIVSLMNVNNVFYRFRHFTQKAYYEQTQAGIKMNIMVKPVLGKEFFELVSLAISAINGCELCVKSHEESVLKHGCTEARVYDAVRLVSIIKGLEVLL